MNKATQIGEQSGALQPDVTAIKARMKATWQDGDYAIFAKYMEPGAIEILEGWNIFPGQRLLDVACGSGQTAIPAARNGLKVTGIDIARNLVESANARASVEKVEAQFDEGDAEQLPYADSSFDVAITMFGAMFAPRPQKVVAELARVIRPGGKLYMANWTTTSMPAQMFRSVSSRVPTPPGFIPPVLWGDEKTVKGRLGAEFTDIQLVRKYYPQWCYDFSTEELVEFFRTYFGPVKRAFDVLGDNEQKTFRQELKQIYTNNSETDGNTIIVKGEYLEVIATRREATGGVS